jgi:hypothetical protein
MMRRPSPIEVTKSSLGVAWDDFTREIEDIRALSECGAKRPVLDEPMRHARELLNVIEREIAYTRVVTAAGISESLARLRDRLQSLEPDVMPARHAATAES